MQARARGRHCVLLATSSHPASGAGWGARAGPPPAGGGGGGGGGGGWGRGGGAAAGGRIGRRVIEDHGAATAARRAVPGQVDGVTGFAVVSASTTCANDKRLIILRKCFLS